LNPGVRLDNDDDELCFNSDADADDDDDDDDDQVWKHRVTQEGNDKAVR
jgi:hypothetical protein